MQYARLARNADLSRQLEASLQAAVNRVRVSGDLVSGNVTMASEAVMPEAPFFPNRERNLLFGGMLGLGLAIILGFIRENSDHCVRRIQHVRRLSPVPIIGTLPMMTRRQLRALESGEAPAQALEAYSLARANLAMAARDALKSSLAPPALSDGHDAHSRAQVILVTSAVPGEGKSLTSAYMARSLALSGRTVVLVDADMRRPAMNRLFNTAETSGLADVLIGRIPVGEAIVRSDTENLFVVHSGTPSRNPSELLSRPQVPEVIDSLRDIADIVIIDTPACAAVADGLLLAHHTDCIVQVVGLSKVNEEILIETTTALQSAGPKVLTYFVNRTPRESRRNHTSYYYTMKRETGREPVGASAVSRTGLLLPKKDDDHEAH
jgi:capsular exopolysaccharide synthesis family protein